MHSIEAKRPVDVRFGSKADMALRICDVRFTPKSGHCRRRLDVRFLPKAVSCTAAILSYFDPLGRADYIRRAPHRCGALHSRAQCAQSGARARNSAAIGAHLGETDPLLIQSRAESSRLRSCGRTSDQQTEMHPSSPARPVCPTGRERVAALGVTGF